MHNKCALIEIGTWTTYTDTKQSGQEHCHFTVREIKHNHNYVVHKPHFAGEV